MSERTNILQELKELQSSLTPGLVPGYQVPESFFENFPALMLGRVKALEAADAREDIETLSPLLSSISRKAPYSVPGGYFQELGSRMPKDEAPEELPAMLAGLKDKPTFAMPAGYFENLPEQILTKANGQKAPVVSITKRSWFRYAAAAVVIAFVAIFGIVYQNQNSVDPETRSYAWVEKNMKKVSTDEINRFVELASQESNDLARIEGNDDISNLLKDVSDKEIQDFLNETLIGENEEDDLLWN